MPSDGTASQEPPGEGEERRLHPFTLLFSTIGMARRLILPAVFGGLSAADGDAGRAVLVVVGVLTIPSFVIAVAHYLSFRYKVRKSVV